MIHGHDDALADGGSIEQNWSESQRDIMEATYRVMLTEGYPDLSVSKIADELGKTKASIYYHYDSKRELLISFLDFVVDQFHLNIGEVANKDPEPALKAVIEKLIPTEIDKERFQGQVVLTELRSQASQNEAYRERFTEINELLVRTICDIIERGIDTGVFRDVRAVHIAEHIVATTNGARTDRVTTDREAAPAAVRASLLSYVDSELKQSK